MIFGTLKEWLNKDVKTTEVENTYTPKAKGMVCVAKTVYPNEKAQFSPNGTGEFYGIVEVKKEEI